MAARITVAIVCSTFMRILLLIRKPALPPTSAKYVTPFFGDFAAFFRGQRMVLRKVFDPAKWPAGVDDGAGIGKVPLLATLRWNPWIDGTAPAATHDFDGCFRIASCGDCPQDIGHVGRIDIVVNDDHEASQVSALAGAQGDVSRLARVAAVTLPQGNDL